MRAVLLRQCGQPPSVGDRDTPVPGDGQRRIRVAAAPIAALDLLCATGTSYFGVPATPYVPGVQGVGELDDGTAVWFATDAGMKPGDGSMAEYAMAGPADIVTLPDGIDHRLIAALGLSAVAAHMALIRGGLRPGAQVLVLGGGGVVGQAAIQLARIGGARRVIAACRSEASRARALRQGADACVPSTGADVATLAAGMKEAADGPVDLVVDPLWGVPAAAALRTLRPGGVLVNFGGSAGDVAPMESSTLRSSSLNVLGYTNTALAPEQRAEAIRAIADHVREGRLTVEYETVPMSDVTEAWTRQAQGTADRRLVLVP